jgi:hypothetical protein
VVLVTGTSWAVLGEVLGETFGDFLAAGVVFGVAFFLEGVCVFLESGDDDPLATGWSGLALAALGVAFFAGTDEVGDASLLAGVLTAGLFALGLDGVFPGLLDGVFLGVLPLLPLVDDTTGLCTDGVSTLLMDRRFACPGGNSNLNDRSIMVKMSLCFRVTELVNILPFILVGFTVFRLVRVILSSSKTSIRQCSFETFGS